MKRAVAIILICIFILQGIPVFADAAYEDKKVDSSIIMTEGDTFSFDINVNAAEKYNYEITYRTIKGRQISPKADITIKGDKVSYLQHIEFTRIWRDIRNSNRFQRDRFGNEIFPETEELSEWQTVAFGISIDSGSKAVELPAGKYSVEVKIICESVEISKIELCTPSFIDYEDYKLNNIKNNKSKCDSIRIQAELIHKKSHSSIMPTYDRSSPSIEPNFSDKISLNIIGGSCYSKEGQWIEWQFDVNKNGVYMLDFRYQQDALREIGVGRRIKIDGKVPFKEFDNILFPYSQNYRIQRLCDENKVPYAVYFEKGKHTLRLEVNAAHLETDIIALREFIKKCDSMYRKIISITGTSPDVYRDYYLDKELPELMPFLKEAKKDLESISSSIEKSSNNKEGSETSLLYDMIRVIDSFLKEPFKIPSRLSNLKNSIDSIADMVATLSNQALILDYITLTPYGEKIESGKCGIFEYLWFRIKSFSHSFIMDYTVSSDGTISKNINVWLGLSDILTGGTASGRDQMQIIKRLSDDSFSEKYGIGVNLSLVSTGDTLVQAILADKGPDVAMFVSETTVANLALRGVLGNMKIMEGFEEQKLQFYESAFIPFTINGGIYAMPETQNFNMMFYRKDIFKELGIKPPETWEEFYNVQKILAQNKLEIGVPESQTIFEMLLLQRGGNIYVNDLTESGLKSQNSVQAFTQWTDLYIKHGLPLVFDFFNRFRTGEMPLGIMNYTMYNQLSVAAPEIEGLWEMVPIPGMVDENKNINRRQSSVNNGCIVIDKSNHTKDAYSFVKWWTDSKTQLQFGRQVEAILGKSARYNTANIKAFEDLNWNVSERHNLKKAWEDVSDIEMTVASYYVSRCISNAFRRVVYNFENTRDVIYSYSDDIDRELERKHEIFEKRRAG